jgi:hypothetical protein
MENNLTKHAVNANFLLGMAHFTPTSILQQLASLRDNPGRVDLDNKILHPCI